MGGLWKHSVGTGIFARAIIKQEGQDQVRDYLSEEMKKEYDAFKARYFDYGKIFAKSEEDLVALNAGYGRFYEAALRATGVALPGEVMATKGIGGWSVHALYLSLGLSFDYRDKVRGIAAPVLVIQGARDVYPEEISQEYADLLPKGKLAVPEQASHFAFEDTPGDFAALVADFLKE